MIHDLNSLQDELFRIAMDMRNSSGEEILPVAFLVNGKGDNCSILTLVEYEKAQWTKAIQSAVRITNASAVVVHTEAWSIAASNVKSFTAHLAGIPIHELPGAYELLQSHMETRTGEIRIIHGRIDPAGNVNAPDIIVAPEAFGRMTGFFK